MKNIILFDGNDWGNFLPLSYTRPIACLRLGILTIVEKWNYLTNAKISYCTQAHLNNKFATNIEEDNFLVHGSIIPDKHFANSLNSLAINTGYYYESNLIFARLDSEHFLSFIHSTENFNKIKLEKAPEMLLGLPDIIRYNGAQILSDFKLLTENKTSEKLPNSNRVIGDSNKIFLEKGAKIECATLNTESGPIYLAKDSEVMEGAMIRGPFGLGEHSAVKMGAKIYPNVSVGPHCKIGGEVGNSILYAYSNKGHDGYLGDSYIGEWCNIGADTNTSNLKNNYAEVKLWQYPSSKFMSTGLQFCGLIMGDHSKAGINTMFNTGTVVGVSCNIFGHGYPRNFIPSFSWGGAAGLSTFALEKAYEASNAMLARRSLQLSDDDKLILKHAWENDKSWRK